MKMNLEMLNNVLVMFVVVLLLVLVSKKVLEKFAGDNEACNAVPHGTSNVAVCTVDTQGQVVTDTATGNRYLCGQTDGYGFLCQ